MPRTDSASRIIDAPVSRVFEALLDRTALETWLPPKGMTARFDRFDPSPGGSYRLVLTYSDPASAGGKSSADSDIVEARYLDIRPDDRVVQAVDFVSDDPAVAGTMTMTWAVRAVAGGTRVEIIAEGVPNGISPEDHATGLNSSLENLARYLGGDSAPADGDEGDGRFGRDFWERRWSDVLEAHPEQVAKRSPSSYLTTTVGGLAPGRALDAGCGHGAEALWLAAHGWRVTAVDFSAAALAHGRSLADDLGRDVAQRIDWIRGDLVTWSPEPGSYDLVSCLYVHVAGSVEEMVARLAAGVAPGGALLLVGHLPIDPVTGAETPAAGQVQVTVDAATAALDPQYWDVSVAEERPRATEGTGFDAVISARRWT